MQGGELSPADRGRSASPAGHGTDRRAASVGPHAARLMPLARAAACGEGRTATMTTSRRVGRWALIVVTVLVAGWVLLRVGVGVYLRTPAGRAVVAHQLQDVIGLPVA